MTIKSFLLSAIAVAAIATTQAAVETYQLDPAHTSIAFNVRHVFTKVPGSFGKFTGTIKVDRDNLEASSAEATIEASSITTANEKRDTHLKSPDFFDVAKYPTLTFKSTSFKKTGDDAFDVTGDLTIHGVTKSVVLKAKLLGFGPGLQPGTNVTGWEAMTTINRSDFGVNGPAMLGKAIGDDVNITISVEADLKK